MAHFFEKLPRTTIDDVCLPDIYMIFPQVVIHFDHEKKVMEIVAITEHKLQEASSKIQAESRRPKPEGSDTLDSSPRSTAGSE